MNVISSTLLGEQIVLAATTLAGQPVPLPGRDTKPSQTEPTPTLAMRAYPANRVPTALWQPLRTVPPTEANDRSTQTQAMDLMNLSENLEQAMSIDAFALKLALSALLLLLSSASLALFILGATRLIQKNIRKKASDDGATKKQLTTEQPLKPARAAPQATPAAPAAPAPPPNVGASLNGNGSVVTSSRPAFRPTVPSTIFDEIYRGRPQDDPTESRVEVYDTPRAIVAGVISYGGPGSKYNKHNEDSKFTVFCNGNGLLFVGVIDGAGGMGPEGTGYKVSRSANEKMVQALQEGRRNGYKTIQDINAELITEFRDVEGAATIAVASISPSHEIKLTAVGDARAIVVRNGRVIAKTRMQNHPGTAGNREQDLYTWPGKHIIQNALGTEFETQSHALSSNITIPGQADDYVLAYSDGVADVISPYELAQLSLERPHPEDLAREILNLAKKRNTNDGGTFDEDGKFKIRIQVTESDFVDVEQTKDRGDNISVQVVKLK